MTREGRAAWDGFIKETKEKTREFLNREDPLTKRVLGATTLALIDKLEDLTQFATRPLIIEALEHQLGILKTEQTLIAEHGDYHPVTMEELLEERERQLEVRDPEEDEGDGDDIPPAFEVH